MVANLGFELAAKRPQGNAEMLKWALEPIYNEILALKSLLPSYLPLASDTSKAICSHVFCSEGKLIRPSLFLLCSKMLNYAKEHLYPIAAVCEYIHIASLLHDDVVDNSSLRRNKPSANRIWGDASAVLVGDLIYSTASEIMAKTEKPELVSIFARAIRMMSEGELLQLDHAYNCDIDEATYYSILDGKTGVLMGACCLAAGILADVSPNQKKALELFGQSLGISFQIIDDALDFCGDHKTIGKNLLSDLNEGRVTLPLILLRKELPQNHWAKVAQIIRKEEATPEDVIFVTQLVKEYNTAQISVALATQKTQESLHIIEEVFAQNDYKDHLLDLALCLTTRAS